jgi:nucleoid DNA-binding protein
MIKADLVKIVTEVTGLERYESELVVNRIFTCIVEVLKRGEKIELRGFGTLGVKRVKAKVGRNMVTGEPVSLPAHSKPYFKPGRELKPWVVEPEKQEE